MDLRQTVLVLAASALVGWQANKQSQWIASLDAIIKALVCVILIPAVLEVLGTNVIPLVISRAIPNERLVRVFRIDNGFTTTDSQYRADFRRQAEDQLSAAVKNGWKAIADRAVELVSSFVGDIENQGSGRLELAVQKVSMKMVLEIFFDVDVDESDDFEVLEIAQHINRLWILSKSQTGNFAASMRKCQKDFDSLKASLDTIVPYQQGLRENPLNLLLPVYEILWRVVAHYLIEIAFRPLAKTKWLDILKNFLANPDQRQSFAHAPGQDGVSVNHLDKEALRLYPPTKRIYRRIHMSLNAEPETVAADIEACHRLPEIRGDNAHRYRSARWKSADASMRRAFMAFGGPPWTCPASKSFGPRIIGILVPAFASGLTASGWRLERQTQEAGSAEVLDDEMELDSNRSERTEWLLRREERD
ncbi:MAG: hypothetical protein Q9181_005955 [Wetmoreana brouardii]